MDNDAYRKAMEKYEQIKNSAQVSSHLKKTAYDPENGHIKKCMDARSAKEAEECYPPEVARPYGYIYEINGPASVELKKELLSRESVKKRQRTQYAEKKSEMNSAVTGVIALVVMAVICYIMERFLGSYEDTNWYTIVAILLFLGMVVIMSILLVEYTEMGMFGIGAALLLTILYLKIHEKTAGVRRHAAAVRRRMHIFPA